MLDTSLFRTGYREGGWKHYDSIAPARRVDGPATDPIISHDHKFILVCGECYEAALDHPVAYEFLDCKRSPESIGSYVGEDSRDYWYDVATRSVVLLNDYSGPGTTVNDDRDLEIEYVDPNLELDALSRWHDTAPHVHTSATDWWSIKVGAPITTGTYAPESAQASVDYGSIEPELRNLYVEGNDGFTSRKLLDEELTRKYHAHLLNMYLDKRTGDIRIGSIRITKVVDGIKAECVNGLCRGVMYINTNDATRDDLETFTLAIIRHGNNHAAKWFVERPTFYKVHDHRCNLTNCDRTKAHCEDLSAGTSNTGLDAEDTVQFLFEHQRYCKDSSCKCAEVLSELVPALAHA